jgi:putative transposase
VNRDAFIVLCPFFQPREMRKTLAQIGGVSGRQIIGISKEHTAGLSVTEPCRKHRISDATFCTWRKKYDGMEVSDAQKLRSLKDEKSPSEETPGGAGSRKRDWPDAVKKLLMPSSRRKVVN